MREFKFRFWNKEKNKMLYWNYEEHGAGIGGYFNHPSIVPMQYTGLKDRNGTEIYEGDIVGLLGLMKGVISFRHGCFGVEWSKKSQLIRGKEFEQFKSYGALKLLVVIGNIYENPELLVGTANDLYFASSENT
jgi:hypothetical protein